MVSLVLKIFMLTSSEVERDPSEKNSTFSRNVSPIYVVKKQVFNTTHKDKMLLI